MSRRCALFPLAFALVAIRLREDGLDRHTRCPPRPICHDVVVALSPHSNWRLHQYKYSGGTFGSDYDPRAPCSDSTTPAPTSDTGNKTASPSASPTTPAPSAFPTTPAPSASPTTPAPTPSPTPSPVAPADPGTYLGCFLDVKGERTMGFGYKDTEGMTNEVRRVDRMDTKRRMREWRHMWCAALIRDLFK